MLGLVSHAVRCLPVLLVVAASACSATVGAVAPRPTISLAPSSQRLALGLAREIPDAFAVPFANVTLHVTGFRASIGNGFAASLGRYYAPATSDADADLILRFETVAIEFVPDSSANLVLRYAARLDDRAGRTLGRSFGTLRPGRSYTMLTMETALAEALGQMFERVAADCFVPLSIAR